MPRNNFRVLVAAILLAVLCYLRAGGAYGRHYGPMADAFVTALKEVRERYLWDSDERKLFEGAMDGLMQQLDDKNSLYMGQEETRHFNAEIKQEFGGIGIEVSWDRETKSLTVQNAIFGTPAFEKGLEQGDKILKINDESTDKLTLKDAVNLLRGKIGEPVRLTILHAEAKEPIDVTIVRATIKINAVLGDRRGDDDTWDYVLQDAPEFGYIRITQFGEKTFDEFKHALAQCRDKHVKGLILDLRSNPGGLLEAAKDVCDQFIKQGVIVRTKDRHHNVIQEYQATGQAPYPDVPLVVLIDKDSASASEIVAACLQDHNRAVVIGQRSYGKGTVQTPIELEGGKSIMRLTIAGFWRPNDQNIHRRDNAKETDVWGVSPDEGYDVKLDDEQRLEIAKQRRKRDSARPAKNGGPDETPVDDPVLEKALEYLREKTGVAAKPELKAA